MLLIGKDIHVCQEEVPLCYHGVKRQSEIQFSDEVGHLFGEMKVACSAFALGNTLTTLVARERMTDTLYKPTPKIPLGRARADG